LDGCIRKIDVFSEQRSQFPLLSSALVAIPAEYRHENVIMLLNGQSPQNPTDQLPMPQLEAMDLDRDLDIDANEDWLDQIGLEHLNDNSGGDETIDLMLASPTDPASPVIPRSINDPAIASPTAEIAKPNPIAPPPPPRFSGNRTNDMDEILGKASNAQFLHSPANGQISNAGPVTDERRSIDERRAADERRSIENRRIAIEPPPAEQPHTRQTVKKTVATAKPTRRKRSLALALALAALPIAGLSAITYVATNQSVTRGQAQAQQAQATQLAERLSQFLGERHRDVKSLAELPVLRDAKDEFE
jgi:hypothetical protein